MVLGKKKASNPCAGSSSIFDAHVHCYPQAVIKDPFGWARQQGEEHWSHLVGKGPQGWAGPEALLRAMDAAGIEKVLLQAWYWEHPATAELQNEWHAEWIERFPERLCACASVHPDMEDPLCVLEESRQWGACAVGECLPQVQSPTGWQHPAWKGILEWTTRAGWPICLHLTETVGHTYPGRVETPLMEVVQLFEDHPRQKWLCAHWGGGLPFHHLNRRVRRALGQVWFDTAASPLLYDRRIWRIACDLVGPEKIIFGSDFPLLLYPSQQTEPDWSPFLAEFAQSGLSETERGLIGRRNLSALIPAFRL